MSDRSAHDRLLDVFEALAGNGLHGLAPGDLARAARVSPSWVSVNLPALAQRGWVERIEESGHWRLGRRFAEIAAVEVAEIDKAVRKVGELRQRYAR